MTWNEERAIRLDEREKVFAEIQTALSCVRGFRPAALKVEEWKGISDRFPENAAAGTGTPAQKILTADGVAAPGASKPRVDGSENAAREVPNAPGPDVGGANVSGTGTPDVREAPWQDRSRDACVACNNIGTKHACDLREPAGDPPTSEAQPVDLMAALKVALGRPTSEGSK